MKKKHKRIRSNAFFLLSLVIVVGSCKMQDDWLNVKRDKSDISPKSLDDFQAVLDNTNTMNRSYPMLGMTGTDNLYLPDANFGSVTQREQNAYAWTKDIYHGGAASDFSVPYIVAEYCNIVLDGIGAIKTGSDEKKQFDNIKGQALFHRAMSLYNLSQLFCKPYQLATAGSDLGLQLKTSADPNEKVKRSSVKQTYEFMLADARLAAQLLPPQQAFSTRPSKRAAVALLAKIYLSMQDYKSAAEAAGQCLGENPVLMDFNSSKIKPSATYVFPPFSNQHQNDEILYYASAQTFASLWPVNNVGFADTLLFKSYHPDDLRRSLFYRQNPSGLAKFTGSYTGTNLNFSGIATNEILLVQAESLARTAQPVRAKQLLDLLLSKRFKTGTFKKMTIEDDQLLGSILNERRKELAFTGQLRWEDLRRFNRDPALASTLVRIVKGQKYELPPGDSRYVFPLPDLEIQLSGVEQNNR